MCNTRRGILALVFLAIGSASAWAADDDRFVETKRKLLRPGDECRISLFPKDTQSTTYEGIVDAVYGDSIAVTPSQMRHCTVRRWGIALANIKFVKCGQWQTADPQQITIQNKQIERVWLAEKPEPSEVKK